MVYVFVQTAVLVPLLVTLLNVVDDIPRLSAYVALGVLLAQFYGAGLIFNRNPVARTAEMIRLVVSVMISRQCLMSNSTAIAVLFSVPEGQLQDTSVVHTVNTAAMWFCFLSLVATFVIGSWEDKEVEVQDSHTPMTTNAVAASPSSEKKMQAVDNEISSLLGASNRDSKGLPSIRLRSRASKLAAQAE